MNSILPSHLEKLVHLLKVSDRQSFSAAATDLRISQPALSHSIRSLEDVLGVTLLRRSRKGVLPTHEGEKLIEAAREILKISHRVENELRNESAEPKRPLRMGTKEPFAIHIWPQFVRWVEDSEDNKLANTLRRTELVIDKANRRLVDLFLETKLDLLLVAEPKLPGTSQISQLFSTDYRFYRSKSRRASIEAPTTFLCYKDAVIRSDVRLGDLQKKMKLPGKILDVQSFDAAREMAIRGLGVALLPHWMAIENESQGLLEEIPKTKMIQDFRLPTSKIYLCFQKGRSEISPLIRALQKFCKANFS